MPKYTLHYFGIRNLAEVSRLIFAVAGQEFTDRRIELEEWLEAKKNSKQTNFLSCPRCEASMSDNRACLIYYATRI